MVVGSKGYLLASFLLFAFDFYRTDCRELGIFGYLYLTKPSTSAIVIRYNFVVALLVVLLKTLAALVCDHLDDEDDYVQTLLLPQKLYKVMRIRTVGVLALTVCYLHQFDTLWFLVVVAEFGHYLCHEYLALQAERLFKWHSAHLSDYLRVLAAYLLLMFADFELLYRSDLRGNGMEARILWEVMVLFAMSLGPCIGLVLATWQAFTHSEFKYLRTNWHRGIFKVHLALSVGILVIQILLLKPPKFKKQTNQLFGIQIFEMLWMVWRVYDSFQRDEQLKEKIKEIEEAYEDDMMSERDKLCVVCFRDMERGRRLACNHILHEDCLKMWLERTSRQTCPKCKQSIYGRRPPKKLATVVPEQPVVVTQIEPLLTVTSQASQPINRNARGRQQQAGSDVPGSSSGYFTGSGTQVDYTTQQRIQAPVHSQLHRSRQTRSSNIRKIRLGSLPFGLPAEAVYRRTKEHFDLRSSYLATAVATE